MKRKQFDDCCEELLKHCKELLVAKRGEYSSNEDVLANCKQPTTLFNTNQAKICLMYDSKHIASMVKMAEDVDKGIIPSKELLVEKVGDYINYGLLFYANMLEIIDNRSLTIKDIDGNKQSYTLKEIKEVFDEKE